MTWNARGLSSKENSLGHLLVTHEVDVAIITEAELSVSLAPNYALSGFTTFLPLVKKGEKTRVVALVRSSLAISANARLRHDIMSTPVQTVWLDLRLPRGGSLVIGGVYRQWLDLPDQREHLDVICAQAVAASKVAKSVIVLGDFNLDQHRPDDTSYRYRSMLGILNEEMAAAGLEYAPTSPTWRSDRLYDGSHKTSCIDHIFFKGNVSNVSVLPDAISDHRAVVARVEAAGRRAVTVVNIVRRNFKAIKRAELEIALQQWPWADIHVIVDVEDALKFVLDGIVTALDIVAPLKAIRVKRGDDLYLSSETLALMTVRDQASGRQYRSLRNRVSSLVRRDRLRSNLAKLSKANGDPKILWRLANEAMGKVKSSLPASIEVGGVATVGAVEAATAMGDFYVEKVDVLRDGLSDSPPPPSDWPRQSSRFGFSFANAGKVSRVVRGMGSTEAVGLDGIPMSVLKKGIEVLAPPIAHLVNRSFASGIVPRGFKSGLVLPNHKGKGKNPVERGSYRPVSILPALSKIIGVIAKLDMESHLALNNALPNSQWGFRPNRSSTAALATAHAKWIQGSKEGNVVGVMAFDLSSAFDTVDKKQLLPKLQALGVGGTALDWFSSYLSDGRQCVEWNGARSDFNVVKFGVRQGSILGPLLYLILVADMPDCLGIGDDFNSGYADDTAIWAIGNLAYVRRTLNERAGAFVKYANGNGLILNASKTQLLVGGKVRPAELVDFSVQVGIVDVCPSAELELLGVKFDSKFSTSPHDAALAKSAHERAFLIAKIAHYIPRGTYLSQLAKGLLVGKVSYALAAVASPRLDPRATELPAACKPVQVAINDVARTILGKKREDHIKLPLLLHRAGLPSYNNMIIRAMAMEAWKAFHSDDGGCGGRNLVGKLVFPKPRGTSADDSTRMTRAEMAGEVKITLRGENTFIVHAATIWNKNLELRSALTKGAAKTIASKIANTAPH